MDKLNTFLNIFIGTLIGGVFGHALFTYRHYLKYPGLYEIQSAPWYTSVIVRAGFTLGLIVIILIIKFVIKRRMERGATI